MNKRLKGISLIFITGIILTGLFFVSYSESINTGLANNMVRLHVIANSNSNSDQILKLKVRDKVLEYTGELLKNTRDIEDTKRMIMANLSNIEEEVSNFIRENSKINYNVKLELGEFPFPTKSYGDVTLPAGNYQAIRVLIGEAKGNNWWCVLFPPLCFVDATHGKISDEVKQKLKNELTTEEYNIITCAQNSDDIPIKVKFKVVEVFQSSKIKISGIMNRFLQET